MMKSFQASAWAATFGMLVWAFGQPDVLPGVAQHGLNEAIDGVARVCLWAWDEPTDTMDEPVVEWTSPPNHFQKTSQVIEAAEIEAPR